MMEVLKEVVEGKGPLHLQQVMLGFKASVIRELESNFWQAD
jgi:hypothetical protein